MRWLRRAALGEPEDGFRDGAGCRRSSERVSSRLPEGAREVSPGMNGPCPGLKWRTPYSSQSPRRQLPTLGIIAAFLCAYMLLGSFGVISPWLMWAGVAIFGAVLLIGLYGVVRGRNASWELRLDRHGVTVRGDATRPWSDIAEVRVTGLRPGWLFIVSLGYRVVAFIGQSGLEMPTLPSAEFFGRVGGSARLRERWYGSQLLLMPSVFGASTEVIVDAVRRFSDVPVHGS